MKRILSLLLLALALGACAASNQAFVEKPADYGLFVASTNLYFDIPLVIKRVDTGDLISIPIRRYAGNYTGYMIQSLPPGRYQIYSYSPFSNVTVPLASPEGFFDVQANCFNYGGYYDFQMKSPPIGYQNTTAPKDIAQLPAPLRKMVSGHDICIATMGDANHRLTAAEAGALGL